MINGVQTALNSILSSIALLNSANGAGRIFELFVMTSVGVRLQTMGFDVWLQRSDGTRILASDVTRTYFQRGGAPSGVPPASAGPGNASVIGIRKLSTGSEWEIWNGIQFEGRSGASHEIDIAVVPRAVGIELRKTGGLPFGRPRVSIECKDVGQPGSVDEMRAFVARLYDLTILQGHQPHLPFPPPTQGIYPGMTGSASFYAAQATYWDENRHSFNAIARRTGFVLGAAAMSSYYAIEPHGFISLGSTGAGALVDAVCQWIASYCP